MQVSHSDPRSVLIMFCCNPQRTEVQVARMHTIHLRAELPNGVRILRRGKGDRDGVCPTWLARRGMSRGNQTKVVDSHCSPRKQMLLENNNTRVRTKTKNNTQSQGPKKEDGKCTEGKMSNTVVQKGRETVSEMNGICKVMSEWPANWNLHKHVTTQAHL